MDFPRILIFETLSSNDDQGSFFEFLWIFNDFQRIFDFPGRGHSPTPMLEWYVQETVGLQTLQSWLCGPGAGGNPGLRRNKL